MRPIRHLHAIAAPTALAVMLAVALAVPVLAKEGMEARLDAPIDPATPPGTELIVGMTVSVPEGDVRHPVQGSPIYLRLIAPDGTVAEQLSREETKLGHYLMRIVVPEGGIADVEVVLRGTTDFPITIVGDALAAAPAVTPIEGPAVAPETATLPWLVVAAGAALGLLAIVLVGRALAPRATRRTAEVDPGGVPGR